MKTKNFVLSGILGIALSGLVLTGCHKSSSTPDTDITAAQDETSGSYASNDSKNVSDNAVGANANKYGPEKHSIQAVYSSHCVVTWSDTAAAETTVTVTVNFGSSPVLCNDGKWRQGEIMISWPVSAGQFFWEAYFNKNTTITQTFNGYKVGETSGTMNSVAGTRTWTNAGLDTLGYESWSFSANLNITRYNGKTFTWVSNRTNALVNQGGAWYYEVTGNATGTTETGATYTITIANPLYATALPWWLGGCAYIESGVVNITRSNSTNTLSINFGTLGECTGTATATLDGNTYTISKWW